jgi:hypothetical protein
MPSDSVHVSVWIGRPASQVYAFTRDPANLARWAAGLGSAAEQVDGRWFVHTPVGPVGIAFAGENPFGVLDHAVTWPSGEVVHVPMRVIADDGAGRGCEVVFTVRRQPGMTDEELTRDVGLVEADLAELKRHIESGPVT